MEAAVKALYLGLTLNPNKIVTHNRTFDVSIPTHTSKRASLSPQMRYSTRELRERVSYKPIRPVGAATQSDTKTSLVKTGVSKQFEDFSVTTTSTNKDDELKINIVVSGTKTQAIFEVVFSKMVADAQPIPGFRRVKGGKTPDIPRDILLEVLGYSKVYKQVIKKVINSTVAEYVEKVEFYTLLTS